MSSGDAGKSGFDILMNIGILGGTFDPIHRGHLLLAEAALKQLNLEKVYFVPAAIPPHKFSREDLSAADVRVEMILRALEGKKKFELSTIELERGSVSYTVDTLREWKTKFPAHELYLVLGEDSYRTLESWKDSEDIRRLARFAIAPRENRATKPEEPGVIWLDFPLCPIASSEIRQRIAAGDPVEDLLPEKVLAWIRNQKLYGYHGSCC